MIGRSRQDRHGAVDLLGEHGAGQGVGPGLDAEGQGLVGPGEDFRRKAVGPADHEHDPPCAAVAQARDAVGERARGVRLAVLVAGDDVAVLELFEDELALGGLAGFPALQLDDLDRTETERTA
jgi:hypothetical protein